MVATKNKKLKKLQQITLQSTAKQVKSLAADMKSEPGESQKIEAASMQ